MISSKWVAKICASESNGPNTGSSGQKPVQVTNNRQRIRIHANQRNESENFSWKVENKTFTAVYVP